MATPLFRIEKLGKRYETGSVVVHALRDISLEIEAGQFIVLLGASGSGKSTLLNIMGGLDTPSEGSVKFRDFDLANAQQDQLTRFRREHVGFVFQFYNLISSLTASENVSLVTDLVPEQSMPAAEALARVGLAERAGHFPSQLSGGEQQRVAIARAIAKRPAILMCDEPTGALDYATGKVVLNALADANRELGTTAIIITHNSAIADMADRVIRLADGRLAGDQVNETRLTADQLSW